MAEIRPSVVEVRERGSFETSDSSNDSAVQAPLLIRSASRKITFSSDGRIISTGVAAPFSQTGCPELLNSLRPGEVFLF